jgi:pimeloyl-ACP methyl ester carboxylesterase
VPSLADYGTATVAVQRPLIDAMKNVRHVLILRAEHAIWIDAPDEFGASLRQALETMSACRPQHV